MSPTQWIKRTNSIGIISKGGRYSIGTFAHPDIAFEFASITIFRKCINHMEPQGGIEPPTYRLRICCSTN